MYTITLANGTALTNLQLNGNNYISSDVIDDSVFAGNLGTVTVTDGTDTTTYEDMVLIQNTVYDGSSWFILAEKTGEDKVREASEKNIARLEKQLEDTQAALNTLLLKV